ncbi:hypothetical protein QBC38DRAFT_420650 [Podospora fimiseda]|uniref:Large ribosomal subunit protein mL50 n=1 Tax=Podospora fimiseda TaxID=252190 RepID=A0AAN7GVH7_9PEZI|nr:hypothetical protein QBC38DRAFT_420650 [Podospora fimiseda]
MRRFQRIRSAASTGICSSSLSTVAPVRTSAAAISNPSSTQQFACTASRPLWRTCQQPRCFSTTLATRSSPVELEETAEYEAEAPAIETDLVYPGEIVEAVPAEDVMDPHYKPAESMNDLVEVGGLQNWWEDPDHWGSSKKYVGFGPTEKVTDPALLQWVARRAVVEALVLKEHVGPKAKKLRHALLRASGVPKELSQLVNAEIVAGPDGGAALKDSESAYTIYKRSLNKKHGAVQGLGATAEEASPLVASWGKEWKKIELRDPVVKFFAATRIHRLTGHIIPDGKLVAITNIDGLVKAVVTPPKPAKLAELVEKKALFSELPNVKVFPRRVTPIDKEKMVGRWKIIARELQEHGLPLTGTGDYGKSVERKWVEGKEQVEALLQGSKSDEESTRTENLKGILETLKKENADELAAAAGKLADAARDASWRIPIGNSGILDFVLSSIPAEGLEHPLNRQALRLIGNSCADCDENRARVVESGKLSTTVKNFMADDALVPFAIAATLNSCVDYEKAQVQVCEAGFSKVLIDIVSGPRLSHVHLSHVMTILEMLSNQTAEPKFANPDTPALLLKLAVSNSYEADLDTFLEICSPALAYLTHQDLQPPFLTNNGLPLLQQAFLQSYTRFPTTDSDPDTADQLKQVWTTFVAIFADISAQPTFATACSLTSSEASTLISWLEDHPQDPHLQTASCLSLGNLSRSDEVTLSLLPRVQPSLSSILQRAIPPKDPDSPLPVPPLQLIHATLSFLKNLAIPQQNKPILGSSLLPKILPGLWTTTTTQPQLQFTAISLTRLLLFNCPENISILISPTPDSSTPSLLSLLSQTAEAADELPTKTESARAVVSVCRALHSPSPSTTPILSSSSPKESYSTHNKIISTSFSRLIAQSKFPPIKTDAIFVLALMSRSDQTEGSQMAKEVIENDVEVFKSIITAITGSDELVKSLLGENKIEEIVEEEKEGKVIAKGLEELSLEPKQLEANKMHPIGMSKVDRENGMVLVAALLQRFGEELTGEKRKLFEEVLRVGGELIVKDREGK